MKLSERLRAKFTPLEVVREVEVLEVEIEQLTKLLKRAKDLAEYWINRECTVNYSQQEYNSWLALGHQSNAMEAIRTALAKKMREES